MATDITRTAAVRPVQILGGSFLVLILIGTVLLMLPECHAPGNSVGPLDCLFTATSAVCVTGLITVDTATAWSRTGQIIILILLQCGGIGIVSFGALFALLLGQKINFRQRELLKEQYGQAIVVNILNIIPIVAGTTLVIELLGAACLLPVFVPEFGLLDGIWHSLFQAVSAFCNAGFSTFTNSLEPYSGNLLINAVICVLIITGGLGFPVIAELLSRRGRKKLSLHTRVVLWASGILILAGALAIFILETGYNPDFSRLPVHSRILGSFFQSITARTAGFNTLRIGSMALPSLMVIQLLMFIGGSPSGTAGGIKTTSFAIGLAAIRAVLTGRSEVNILDRRVARDTVRRALVLHLLAAITVGFGLILLLMTGTGDFFKLGFEAVSAFGTVGLSMGITPVLTVGQKIVIILLMFIGRLGPMTFALALAKPRHEMIKFPETFLLTG
jgi:trk system potassium uptake protein TrkH